MQNTQIWHRSYINSYQYSHKRKKRGCPKACENRTIRMNRSIQAEGTFGVLKWDKSYKRLFRRGEKNVILELTLISCGFNLYKYHNKKLRQMPVLAFLYLRTYFAAPFIQFLKLIYHVYNILDFLLRKVSNGECHLK